MSAAAGQEHQRPASGVRRMLRGFGILAGATLVSRLIGFAVLALVARAVGPDVFGAFNFALSIAAFLVFIPANFGLATLGIRDIAQGGTGRASRVAGEVLTLQGAIAACCLATLLVAAPLISDDPDVRALLPIVGVYYVLYAITPDWVLQALQRMTAVALVRLAGQVVFGVLTPILLVDGLAGAERYAWLTVAGAGISAGLALIIVARATGAPRLPASRAVLGERLRRSLPLGVSAAMVHVYYSIDQVLLGYLESTEEVGIYAAATKIPYVLIGFAAVWSSALYPHASALAARSPAALRGQVGLFTSLSLAVALPMLVGGAVVAEDLVVAIFGAEYRDAALPFAVLMLSTAVVLVSVNVTQVLLAIGEERHFAWSVAAGALINVVLNLVLIPVAGATGAAVATVAAEVVVFAMNTGRLVRRLGRPELETRRLAGVVAATAVMAVVVVLMPAGVSVWVRLGVAAAAYAVGAVAFGAVRRSDAALLRGARGGAQDA